MKAKSILLHSSLLLLTSASAAVPLRWEVETSRVQPVAFEAVRGETLDLEAVFKSYGRGLEMPTNGCCMLWQTNGMGSAWWSAGASCGLRVEGCGLSVETNWVVKARFTPGMDPGGDTVIGFLGATGQNYRAAFRIRFRHGPGEVPNAIDAPMRILDLAHTVVVNPPWPTAAEMKAYIDGEIEGAVGIDAATAGTIATNAISNVVTKAYVEGLVGLGGLGGCDTNAVDGLIAKYDETNLTARINAKANAADVYTKEEVEGLVGLGGLGGCDTNAVGGLIAKYDETNLTARINAKANAADVYTKTEVNAATGEVYAAAKDYTEEVRNFLTITFDNVKADKATTLAGYGITDADTKTEAAAKFYPKSQGDAWSTYWDGDEVRVTITNYFGNLDDPHLYLEQRTNTTGTAKYKTVWDEVTRWDKFTGAGFAWSAGQNFGTWKTNVEAEVEQKADRAWGFYDSSTGGYAPAGYTQISSPSILVASGLAYQKHVVGGCEIWTLEATEPTSITGVATNGAFQIKDSDGNVQLEIVKGDKRTVGARCGSVVRSASDLVLGYSVVSAEPPMLEICTDLAQAAWQSSGEFAGATVAWSGGSGNWVATITPANNISNMFVKASYQAGGDPMIKANLAVKLSQLVIGSTTYNIGTATISGSTVLTLTPAP